MFFGRCHHAARVPRKDAELPRRSESHTAHPPRRAGIADILPRRLERRGERSARSKRDANCFPAGSAYAYNSHHAPSWTTLLLAERRQFTPPPVFTPSLILLGVPLAFSGALQCHKQEHQGYFLRPPWRRGLGTGRGSGCQGNAKRLGACPATDALAEAQAATSLSSL